MICTLQYILFLEGLILKFRHYDTLKRSRGRIIFNRNEVRIIYFGYKTELAPVGFFFINFVINFIPVFVGARNIDRDKLFIYKQNNLIDVVYLKAYDF